MENRYHFIITKYCPKEQIFDGMMTVAEAHKFMDENATDERRVGFKVFNELYNNGSGRWEDYQDSYHGGRKVYDNKGKLYILDPDYRSMWEPDNQRFHLWCTDKHGNFQSFIQSFATEEAANKWRDHLQKGREDYYTYIVKPSDIQIENE